MRALLIIIIALFMAGCGYDHYPLAQQYKLELNYYENSVRFLNQGMKQEAIDACHRTQILRNECFTTLVQHLMMLELEPGEFCDEIRPGQGMNMTMKAFKIVYDDMDRPLYDELKLKLDPSEERIQARKQIKHDCENFK
jgi:hypothetical protein